MATKNPARTVIEGGRYRGNTWQRRASNAVQRTCVASTRLRRRPGGHSTQSETNAAQVVMRQS